MATEGRVAWAAVEVWAAAPNEERVDWAGTVVWAAGDANAEYIDWAATIIWAAGSQNADHVDWAATIVWNEPSNVPSGSGSPVLMQGILMQGRIDIVGWLQGQKMQGGF